MINLMAIALLVFALGAVSVLAGNPDGTEITVGTISTKGANTINNQWAEGGNVTNLDINQTLQTSVWQAFYGDIVTNIVLMSGSDSIKDWADKTSGFSGWIFFANSSSITWSSLTAGTGAMATAEDVELSLTSVDNVSTTLSGTTHAAVNVGAAIPQVAANTAASTTTTSQGGTDWTTALFSDVAGASGTKIYGAQIDENNLDFAGNSADYQIIVPTDGSNARNYYVFANLE